MLSGDLLKRRIFRKFITKAGADIIRPFLRSFVISFVSEKNPSVFFDQRSKNPPPFRQGRLNKKSTCDLQVLFCFLFFGFFFCFFCGGFFQLFFAFFFLLALFLEFFAFLFIEFIAAGVYVA